MLVGDFLLVIIGAFVLPQFTRLTDRRMDGQTDGQTLIGKTALHTMHRGKNGKDILLGFRTTAAQTRALLSDKVKHRTF